MDLSKRYHIEKLKRGDVEEAARLLMGVFNPNPAYRQIFRNPRNANAGLYHMFRAELLLQNDRETFTHIVKTNDDERIVALCTLLPSSPPSNRLKTYTRLKPLHIIFSYGLPPLWRMWRLGRANRGTLDRAVGQRDYNYLASLVVETTEQGAGIGSRLLGASIRAFAAKNEKSQPIALTTQLPENVTFYQKNGFKLLEESTVRAGNMSYYNYCMQLEHPSAETMDRKQ